MGTVQRVSVSLPIKDAQLFKNLSKKEKELFVKILSSWLRNEKLDTSLAMEFTQAISRFNIDLILINRLLNIVEELLKTGVFNDSFFCGKTEISNQFKQ